MLNFKDFVNGQNNGQNNNDDDKLKDMPEDKVQAAKKVIEKYSGMSESELTGELAKTIKEQKGANKFDKNAVLSKIDSIGSMLTPEQKESMIKLLNDLS